MRQLIAWLLFINIAIQIQAFSAEEKPQRKCLFINSYHKGYEWSDGIQEAALKVLRGHCSVETFYMDTKRNETPDYGKQEGLKAKAWIESKSPDVVLVSDDAAVEYVLKDHFKGSSIPFVFCGINWEASKYGLPFKNATGMIEVAPVEELVKHIREIDPKAKTAVYLSGDVLADRANYKIFSEIYEKYGITLKPAFAKTMKSWGKMFVFAQSADVVIVANYAGIRDWSPEKAKEIIQGNTKKMTVSYHEFMKSLVAFSLTKTSQEQGQWAGQVAIELLKGTKAAQIPVAVNRRWNVYVNEDVARLSHTKIPESVSRKASKVSL